MKWTTFIIGPCPNSDPSRPKNGLQVGHINTWHVFDELSETPTPALDVAAMPVPCPPLNRRVSMPSTPPCCSLSCVASQAVPKHSPSPLWLALAVVTELVAAIAAQLSSTACNQSTPPCLPCSNQAPPHLHCYVPTSRRLFSGPFRRRGRPSPERLARSRPPPWPGGHGPPLAEPCSSSGAQGCVGARAPLSHHRRWPPLAGDRADRGSPALGRTAWGRRRSIFVCVFLLYDEWAQESSGSRESALWRAEMGYTFGCA
jgi:hypothetical protein